MRELTDKQQDAFKKVVDKAMLGVEFSMLNCADGQLQEPQKEI